MNYHYTLEIEVTNYCNANCIFCANKSLDRDRGYIDEEKLRCFLKKHRSELVDNIFWKFGAKDYPRVTFCGLGDPLLHPHISEIVKDAHELGFFTQLVTNGYNLSPDLVSRLGKSGLDELVISLHSLNSLNYYQITNLSLDRIKERMCNCASHINNNDIKLSIWRIYHPELRFRDGYDLESYHLFLEECGLKNVQILGPSEPWYRDGVVPNSLCRKVQDEPFWCNKILFTFNIDWQGNVILCCNDYNRETVALDNVFSSDFNIKTVIDYEKNILAKKLVPDICVDCRRWKDTEIFDVINDKNINIDAFFKLLEESL